MTEDPIERRDLLGGAAALALAAALPAAAEDEAPPQPGPAMRAAAVRPRTPGRPGDFAFLDGHWLIRNQRRGADGRWERFDGEATCHGLLAGAASVEELRIPARQFSGLGLRLLDRRQQLWIDHWIAGASGVVAPPGLPGSFENGAGIFEAEDEDDGKPVLWRSVWDEIGERGCRWQQGRSLDGGRTWELDWSMRWTRRV